MPTRPKERDIGWFWYDSGKVEKKPPVEAAPPSQIDCLVSIQRVPEEPPGVVFRETDSKYVRLAKMGGRQNLLSFNENTPNTGPAKDYNRTDWYYLMDNQLQDRDQASDTTKAPYEFGQPEWYAHESFNAAAGATGPTVGKASPWAIDKNQNNMLNCKDKLPEHVMPGYGVRSQIPLDPKTFPSLDDNCYKPSHPTRNKSKLSRENTKEKVEMGKIMSNEYEKEWQDRISRHAEKREKAQETLSNTKTTTEYNKNYGAHSQSQNHSRSGRPGELIEASASPAKTDVLDVKEPFKLSKFKNVSSKVDSHSQIKTTQTAAVDVKT